MVKKFFINKIINKFEIRIAQQISLATEFYEKITEIRAADFNLSDYINCPIKIQINDIYELQKLSATAANEAQSKSNSRSAFLLNGNLNMSLDIQELLVEIHKHSDRRTRVFAAIYNPYFGAVYRLFCNLFKFNKPQPRTFFTKSDLESLASLADFEIIESLPSSVFPFKLFGIGKIIDKTILSLPVLRELSFIYLVVLKPKLRLSENCSLSIIVPARDEKDNIPNLIRRLPKLNCRTELIFVEGHSRDETWQEILKIQTKYSSEQLKIKALQQSGKGKADAVKLGIDNAECELVTILDADLTVAPEMIARFHAAYCEGKGDFINGNRLLYPLEKGAMQYLNFFGNVIFAKLLTFVLKTKISDSLCGTKLFTLADYKKFCAWRTRFNSIDPFGDFDLIIPASLMKLDIINLPINYAARTYGTTKISRFSDGWLLLRVVLKVFFQR